MSAEVITFPAMTEAEAERVTEQIAYRIDSITENYEVVMSLMRDALARNAHEALGYASPGAYIADRFGRSLQTLGASLRREFVHELSDAGLSTRAIAPVFGVGKSTIARELDSPVPGGTPEPRPVADLFAKAPSPNETLADLPDTFQVDGMTVTRNGDVLDSPTTTELTFTEKIKTVTGLDGKTYKRPEPKPVPRGDDANKLNAIQASKAIGNALESLQYLNYDKARHGIVTDWWPLGNHEVPPEQSAYFTPAELRKLAQGLIRTAELLEAQRVD